MDLSQIALQFILYRFYDYLVNPPQQIGILLVGICTEYAGYI